MSRKERTTWFGRHGLLGPGGVALGSIGAAAILYWLLLRRPILNWGATSAEASARLPGDELLEDADGVATRVITIDAPAAGSWSVSLTGAACDLQVTAQSYITFSFYFAEFVGRPQHDGWAPNPSILPRAGTELPCLAYLDGGSFTEVVFQIRSVTGEILVDKLPLVEGSGDKGKPKGTFFGHVKLPDVECIIHVTGKDSTGNDFVRMHPIQFIPDVNTNPSNSSTSVGSGPYFDYVQPVPKPDQPPPNSPPSQLYQGCTSTPAMPTEVSTIYTAVYETHYAVVTGAAAPPPPPTGAGSPTAVAVPTGPVEPPPSPSCSVSPVVAPAPGVPVVAPAAVNGSSTTGKPASPVVFASGASQWSVSVLSCLAAFLVVFWI